MSPHAASPVHAMCLQVLHPAKHTCQAAALQVEGPGGGSSAAHGRCGYRVWFRDGELALWDAATKTSGRGEGIKGLQRFVDVMLPPGQQLKALLLTDCGGPSRQRLGSHACRQLAATTRLELRRCTLDFPALLRQAPDLQELVIEDCTQQSVDVDDRSSELSLAVLPPGLKRLSLMSTDLKDHQDFPSMPGGPRMPTALVLGIGCWCCLLPHYGSPMCCCRGLSFDPRLRQPVCTLTAHVCDATCRAALGAACGELVRLALPAQLPALPAGCRAQPAPPASRAD